MKVGFFSLLTIVFIALKLMGAITWSWWWVFAPIWGAALAFVIFTIVFINLCGTRFKL